MKSVAPVKLSAAEMKKEQTGRVGALNAPCETSNLESAICLNERRLKQRVEETRR